MGMGVGVVVSCELVRMLMVVGGACRGDGSHGCVLIVLLRGVPAPPPLLLLRSGHRQ